MSKKAFKGGREGGAPVLKRSGFLNNVKVFVPPKGIPFLSAKLQIWRQKVPEYGGTITQDPRETGITHVLVGSGGTANLPPELRPPKPRRAQQQPQQPQQQQQQPLPLQHAALSGSETTAPTTAGGAAAGGGVSSAEAVGGREAPNVGQAPIDSVHSERGHRAGQEELIQEADVLAGAAAASGGPSGAPFPSRQQPPPDKEAAPTEAAAGGAAGGGAATARPAGGGEGGQHSSSSSSTSTVPFTSEQLQKVLADMTSMLRPSTHTAVPEARSACNLVALGAAAEEKAGSGQRSAGGLEEGGAANRPMPMEIVPADAAADATAATAAAGAAKPEAAAAAAAEAAPQSAAAKGEEAGADGGTCSGGSPSGDVEQLPQQPAEIHQAGVPVGRGQKRARQPAPAEAGSEGKQKGQPTPPASPLSTSSAPRKLRPRPAYVAYTWLERCLLLRRVLPAADFPPAAPTSSAESGGSSGDTRSHTTLTRQAGLWRQWMGEEQWHPGCADMPLDQLVLQGIFNKERSQRIGNEPLVATLKELMKYEEALSGDYVHDAQHGGEPEFNHGALNYARAAATVRACSYRLTPPVSADQLPYVGASTVNRINDILETGTTDVLEAFRADLPVRDSRGALRRGTAGARTRSLFKSLPGVGVATAKQWWDMGLRKFAEVEAAGKPGGTLEGQLSALHSFVLRHHADIREATRPEEWEEMQAAVMEALEAVSSPGWELHSVGGQARTRAVHDADMMVTHPTERIDYSLMRCLVDRLVDRGRLVPPGEGFCMMTAEKTSHMNRRKTEHLWDLAHNVKDKLETHCMVYGCFKTSGGHLRRLDIIIVPPRELPYALIGWIGSRQFLRFMRSYCDKMPMGMNSHRLVREEQGQVVLVPDEAPPLNRQGKEWWPPGWGPGRVAQSQRDVFELVGLPYREPWERDCP